MTELRFIALDTETVRALQAGNPDANGQVPERLVSDGSGVPCRHCLNDVAAGARFLVLAHRPFPEVQPYGLAQIPAPTHPLAATANTWDGEAARSSSAR